jgi:hypothetical protein
LGYFNFFKLCEQRKIKKNWVQSQQPKLSKKFSRTKPVHAVLVNQENLNEQTGNVGLKFRRILVVSQRAWVKEDSVF